MKEKVTNALSLPKEITMDLPLLTATGRNELSIENYKSLLEFTDSSIRIRTKEGDVTIEGENLHLQYITTENILITGRISGIFL